MGRMLPARLVSFSNQQHQLLFLQVPVTYIIRGFCRANGRFPTRITQMFHDHEGVFLRRMPFDGFRTFCTSDEDLAIKKCVPCDTKNLRPMSEQAANELIPKVPGWKLANEGGIWKLNRSWKVKSFTKGLEFFQAIADVAEVEGHHPDLHLVGWNNVKIEIWTHAVGGLTDNDFILAAKINGLDLQNLLRHKASAT